MREDIEGGNCSSWPTMVAGCFAEVSVFHSFACTARDFALGAQEGRQVAVAQKI